MAKRILTATAPDGTTVTRQTDRDYKYVIMTSTGDHWNPEQWASRLDLAESAASSHRNRSGIEVRIIPVNEPEPDKLPERQIEFLQAVAAGEPVVKNAATRLALIEKGMIEPTKLWTGIVITPAGYEAINVTPAEPEASPEPLSVNDPISEVVEVLAASLEDMPAEIAAVMQPENLELVRGMAWAEGRFRPCLVLGFNSDKVKVAIDDNSVWDERWVDRSKFTASIGADAFGDREVEYKAWLERKTAAGKNSPVTDEYQPGNDQPAKPRGIKPRKQKAAPAPSKEAASHFGTCKKCHVEYEKSRLVKGVCESCRDEVETHEVTPVNPAKSRKADRIAEAKARKAADMAAPPAKSEAREYTVIFPDGTSASKKSGVVLTHAVAVQIEGVWKVSQWNGSESLARRHETWRKNKADGFTDIVILPVQ